MWTAFVEDFNDNMDAIRQIWNVQSHYKRDLGFLVDNPLNIGVQNGNLELKMRYVPNYLDSIWKTAGWQHVYSDYTGAEISTKELYHYGIYECRAKYAKQPGSWPAFWIIGGDGIPCESGGGYGNEIDIAEQFSHSPFPVLSHIVHRYYPPDNCDESNHKLKDLDSYLVDANEQYQTYKCIWTPFKIEYYVNNSLRHTVNNTGQEWFPSLRLSVVLSQQICTPFNQIGQQINPVTPQTTYFDYISIKQFFLAPEITINNISCLASTATLDIDPAATNITWQLTPSTFFTTLNGTGKTANIAKVSGANGEGKITYSFQMPSGETFTAEKDIWVGAPLLSYITDPTNGSNPVNFYAVPSPGSSTIDNYTWIVSPDAYIYSWMDHAEITFPEPNYYYIGVEATNACGCSNRVYKYFMYYGDFLMSPNPASTEVEITISAGLAEGSKSASLSSDDEYTVTVLDIYGTVKIQKKYSGNKFTIPVSNLKDGNYIVKVNNKKINSSKQLIVKH